MVRGKRVVTSKLEKERNRAIEEYVTSKLDERTLELIRGCMFDLYQGPLYSEPNSLGVCAEDIGLDNWPGFSSALEIVRRAIRDSDIGDLWVTHDACVFDTEPEWRVTCDECQGADDDECASCDGVGTIPGEWPENYIHYERAYVLRIALGSELAQYL